LQSTGAGTPLRPASGLLSSSRGGQRLGRRVAGGASQLNGRRRLFTSSRLTRRRIWVLQLWEAFLLQMDDFDRLLEYQLRRKLDPVVAAPVPVRRGRAGSGRPGRRDYRDEAAKTIAGIRIDLRPEALVFLEHP
jgi:hypothetical protein